ncbi:mechanosensitive ion channel domain-containing protein [Brucella sp. TWI432]
MDQKATEVFERTNQFLFQISDLLLRYSLSTLGAIVILCAGWILAGTLQRWTVTSLSGIRGLDKTISKFFGGIIRYSVLAIVFVMVLGQFGVQTASILAALGAIGLAIGLALQGTLQNIAAGIMLLVLRPFRVGEFISAGSVVGTVEEIGLFTTELKSYDGVYIVAPNSTLWNTSVINYSRLKMRMHDFKVRIGYDDNIDNAFSIIQKIVLSQEGVLQEPKPTFFVDELGDSAVILCYRYWIDSNHYWDVVRNTTKSVKTSFDEAGIKIPYQQVTYHMKAAA